MSPGIAEWKLCVLHDVTLNKKTFCPRNVNDVFFRFPEHMLIVHFDIINRVTFTMESQCVFWDVRIDSK